MTRLARLAPIQIPLQIRGVERKAGRTTIDDTADGRPVTLAEAGDDKEFAEAVAGHASVGGRRDHVARV